MFLRYLALLLAMLVVCLLSGCAAPKTTTTVLSTAGTFGPKLTKPLSQDQHILVLSVLRDIRIDIIGENIFIYNELGTTSLPAEAVNILLSRTMAATLRDNGYGHLESAVINNSNVLNTTDIQWSHDQFESRLSEEARQFLSQVVNHRNVNTIILLTQSGSQPLAFDVKCEISKRDLYRQASIEPHLYLYKIYVIDAHTLKILTWITGSAHGHLQDTSLCKPISQYQTQDFNELRSILAHKLESSVAKDLTRTLGT